MRLYDSNIPSGNSYKVQLILAQLRIEYELTTLDILRTPSETREAEFLAKNPNGRIPTLEFDDGRLLPESNAILFYLADGTPFLSADRFERAQTLQWLFFEQYSHEPYVAVLKFWTYWGGLDKLRKDELEKLHVRSQAALQVMEKHLESRSFFVADRYSIADISLFAYTQSADQIGLKTGPAVRTWLERVRKQPNYVPIKRDPLGKAPSQSAE
jgi:glutathione S-transferase